MVNTRDLYKNLEIKQDYKFWNEWFIEKFGLEYEKDAEASLLKEVHEEE